MARFGSFFDGEMSRQERACVGSFARHGHEITVFSYGTLDLPAGVKSADASRILPRERLYRADVGGHVGTIGQFSDHFRYVMIKKTGLVWIDTDIICLSPTWPDREWLIARQDQCLLNGAVLGCPQDHPALDRAIAVAERMAGMTVWGLIGPHLLTALSWEFDFIGQVMPANAFYPLHYSKATSLIRPLQPGEKLEIPGEALCFHLWNELLRQAGLDRQAPPPANSALKALIDYAESI